MTSAPLLCKALAEMAGTFVLIFVGIGSIFFSEKFPNIAAFGIPLTWGITVCLLIMMLGGISGAHFNPAVTLAFAIAKRIPPSQILLYWGSQFAGGIAAILLLMTLMRAK